MWNSQSSSARSCASNHTLLWSPTHAWRIIQTWLKALEFIHHLCLKQGLNQVFQQCFRECFKGHRGAQCVHREAIHSLVINLKHTHRWYCKNLADLRYTSWDLLAWVVEWLLEYGFIGMTRKQWFGQAACRGIRMAKSDTYSVCTLWTITFICDWWEAYTEGILLEQCCSPIYIMRAL